jgi:phosphatidylglycerophosphate synthase
MLVPSSISALRLVALPLFLYFFFSGNTTLATLVFASAAVTDLIDGYIARKLGVKSKFGAYFDAAADFIFIAGIFAAFTIRNYYPSWMIVLIAVSFTQFLFSSFYTKRLYDPLGKYVGSVLYIAIALTLLSPSTLTFTFVQVGSFLFATASIVTRTASFYSTFRKNHFSQKLKIEQSKPIAA